jgi:hypothetical protein
MDLDIQKREADLVIGTFGRSIYILDDIHPLREIAASSGKISERSLKLFKPAEAVIVDGFQSYSGSHFPADAVYQGENKSTGARIKAFVNLPEEAKPQPQTKEEIKKKVKETTTGISKPPIASESGKEGVSAKDSLKIKIFNLKNELIKTITQYPDSGLNVITWRLDEGELKIPRRPSATGRGRFGGPGSQGKQVLPGNYKVVAQFKGDKDSTEISVIYDPRIPKSLEALTAQRNLLDNLFNAVNVLYEGNQMLTESKETAGKITSQIQDLKDNAAKELQKATKAIQDSLNKVQDFIFGKQQEGAQGIIGRQEVTVTGKISEAMQYIQSRPGKPTATEEKLVKEAKSLISEAVGKINAFYAEVWPKFREKVEKSKVPLFKEVKTLKLE